MQGFTFLDFVLLRQKEKSQLPNYWQTFHTFATCGALPQYVVMTYKAQRLWWCNNKKTMELARITMFGALSRIRASASSITFVGLVSWCDCLRKLHQVPENMWHMICFSRGYTVLDDVENFLKWKIITRKTHFM